MRQQAETNTEPTFTRRKKVGINLVELTEGESFYCHVTAQDTFTSKNYPDGIEYFDVVNLKTGEEQRMWIDGGLRGALSNMGGVKSAVGQKLEILKGPQKKIEVGGEKVNVNTYQIWLID